jgi:hypothetical protein
MKAAISPDRAAALISDGSSLLIGGFMGVGSPHRLIDALVRRGSKDLTIIANDTALPEKGIGKLVRAGAFGLARLQENGGGHAVGLALIGQVKPTDARKNGRPQAIGPDFAHAPGAAENARASKRVSQKIAIDFRGRRVLIHSRLSMISRLAT